MSSGGRNDYFRDCGEHPRKRPQWKPHARRVCWDHSVDADIGLGPPSYPRPFRGGGFSHIWWISGIYYGLLSFGNPTGRQCFLIRFPSFESSLYFLFLFLFGGLLHHGERTLLHCLP